MMPTGVRLSLLCLLKLNNKKMEYTDSPHFKGFLSVFIAVKKCFDGDYSIMLYG